MTRYVLVLLIAFASPASAAVTLTMETVGLGPVPVLTITDEIQAADDVLFRRLADEAARVAKITTVGDVPFIVVRLDSLGGHVGAAVNMGELIRERTISTEVLPGSRCASACAFVLQAGATRTVQEGARIGLHRPRFPADQFAKLSPTEAGKKYNNMLAALGDYWRAMGGTDAAFKIMLITSSDRMEWLSSDDARVLGIDGQDPAIQELMIAKHGPLPRTYQPHQVDYDPFAAPRR